MTFAIDTGHERPTPKGWSVDDSQTIRFTDWTRADRHKRQIIDAIEEHEEPTELDDYMQAESIVIDALHMFDPAMSQEIDMAAQEHRARLVDGAGPRTAEPCIPNAQTPITGNSAMKGKTMFNFDAGATGSEGPFIQWSARGTQDGAVPARSFYLREEGGSKTPIDAFNKGVVLDIHTMKTGWQRSDGIAGQAPEWKWNPDIAHMQPQPGDDYKRGFQIRCALGGGKSGLWEQAGAAAWNAFLHIVPALQQGPGDGTLPMVKLTGTKDEKFTRGSTVTPLLEVVKWVPRPDCLKEGTEIAVEPAPAAAAPAQPAPAPAAQPVDEEIGF